MRSGHEVLGLPYDSGPLPEPRCSVCGGWINRPQPPLDKRITYVVKRERWVKIGMTGNLRERFGVLSRSTEGCITVHPVGMNWSSPLQLVTVIEGDVEHELHDRFRHAHADGEWFEFYDDVLREWCWRMHRLTYADYQVLPSEEVRLLEEIRWEEQPG